MLDRGIQVIHNWEMPELPEIETIRRGLLPHLRHKKIISIIIRNYKLRWPIDAKIIDDLLNQTINNITRRGKYLLFHLDTGILMIHLGMSGRLRLLPSNFPIEKHDHVDFILENNLCLRFNDPRRFGSIFYFENGHEQHPLLNKLGIEPLEQEFNGNYLFEKSRHKKVAVKLFIMNSHIVTGVGNIYANEALFAAKINPKKSAGKITLAQYNILAKKIKKVLQTAISAGGTTLKDFVSSEGKPGYFSQQLKVYDRGGKECLNCGTQLKEIRLGQRQTVYCTKCQE